MDKIKPFEPLWGTWICEGVLGEGSFGRVYRAVRNDSGRRYYSAVKHISVPANEQQLNEVRSSGNYRSDAEVSQFFDAIVRDVIREIDFMYALKGNANIVSYEDHMIVPKKSGVGCDIFIRMELLRDLNSTAAAITPSEAVKIGIDICTALEVCVKKNIIHRDIKPSNIFVNEDGTYKLGDFGIARVLSGTTTGMSKKGTYSYMSPEIYKCESANFTSDIYSLGVVLYKLLNEKRLPFIPLTGVILPKHNDEALIKMVSGAPMPPPVNASPMLAAVILQACSYNKRDRFQHASAFKKALIATPEFSGSEPVSFSRSAPAPIPAPASNTVLAPVLKPAPAPAHVPDSKPEAGTSEKAVSKPSSAAPKKGKLWLKLLIIFSAVIVAAGIIIGISLSSSPSEQASSHDSAAAQALEDYNYIKQHYTPYDYDKLLPVFNSLSACSSRSKECRDACGDGIFTLLKLRGNTYSTGYSYTFRFFSIPGDPTLYIDHEMWNQDGIQGFLYDENRGKHGIVTLSKDGTNYEDWFEIVRFNDPTLLKPDSLTVRNPVTDKDYTFILKE